MISVRGCEKSNFVCWTHWAYWACQAQMWKSDKRPRCLFGSRGDKHKNLLRVPRFGFGKHPFSAGEGFHTGDVWVEHTPGKQTFDKTCYLKKTPNIKKNIKHHQFPQNFCPFSPFSRGDRFQELGYSLAIITGHPARRLDHWGSPPTRNHVSW